MSVTVSFVLAVKPGSTCPVEVSIAAMWLWAAPWIVVKVPPTKSRTPFVAGCNVTTASSVSAWKVGSAAPVLVDRAARPRRSSPPALVWSPPTRTWLPLPAMARPMLLGRGSHPVRAPVVVAKAAALWRACPPAVLNRPVA